MTRTVAREIAVHMIFQLGFSDLSAQQVLEDIVSKERFTQWQGETRLYEQYPNKKQADYIHKLVLGAFEHSPELDDYISQYAVGWSFHRIPRVAAAIMRVAMYEILYMPEIPNSVAINDALEIAKHYDDPEVVSFINGILGSFVRTEFADTPPKPAKFVEEEFDETDEITQELAQVEVAVDEVADGDPSL